MHFRRAAIALAVCLVPAPATAADILVGPGGFATLAEAIRAAMPGDRILLTIDVFVGDPTTAVAQPVDRALTIESMGMRRSIKLIGPAGLPLDWPVTAEVTFRNVRIQCANGDLPQGSLVIDAPTETVRFDDVEVDDLAIGSCGGEQQFLVSIRAREVLMRQTQIVARDWCPISGPTLPPQGSDALVIVKTDLLFLEDTSLRAARSDGAACAKPQKANDRWYASPGRWPSGPSAP